MADANKQALAEAAIGVIDDGLLMRMPADAETVARQAMQAMSAACLL